MKLLLRPATLAPQPAIIANTAANKFRVVEIASPA
jgi:hypothetical protein